MTNKMLVKAALGLPPEEKIKLIDLLIMELDVPNVEVEIAWVNEIKRRAKGIDEKSVKLISYEKVMAKYKK